MTQPYRLSAGGAIDRSRPLHFTFDGARYEGFAGDSLAAALLANGVRLVGRSFKYHRPRGIFTNGPEEPNALIQLRSGGARTEPNTRATIVELFDGLEAESQNRWPSLKRDFGAVASWFAPLLPAGFYYKTFMAPKGYWEFYERFIRKAAGLGRVADEPDPDHYEKCNAHCDVMVVGSGPTGLAAALAAGRTGARVMLVDERAEFGGSLRWEGAALLGAPAAAWLKATLDELRQMPEVRFLNRTTVFGYYDHNLMSLIERVGDHLAVPDEHTVRQRMWLVRAKQVVLATGAIERPLVFANNDRPGVMLASAARAYVNHYAVCPGIRAVIATNNDSGYATALDLQRAGIQIVAVVDSRAESTGTLPAQAARAGIECRFGHAVAAVHGGHAVRGVSVIPTTHADDHGDELGCDLVCVAGGWTPSLHLHAQSGGKAVWNEALTAFVPGPSKQAERSAGAASGVFGLVDCVGGGFRAGAEAAQAAGFGSGAAPAAPDWARETTAQGQALWSVAAAWRGKRFVDIQDDVTVRDIGLAHREGYRSVEHLKRYTTLGMGTDQGKTSNVIGLALLAELRGEAIPAVGTTTFRPPYTPVTLGAFAGRDVGRHFEPIRRTAMHDWHEAAGAVFIEAGLWLRASHYPKPGESVRATIAREAVAVRNNVGLVDVSTLGKIDIQGPDAAAFLDRVYTNTFSTLAVGRARYGLMLREDGMVFDDGTTSRLAEQRYLMTTTTANAVRIMQHLEYLQQVVWPELRVHATSVTEQWAAMALAGPNARKVLERVASDCDVSDAALSYMGVVTGKIAGIPARIFRISFSGERSYEINVPADFGQPAWEALMTAGRELGITPYGLEAMGVMRIEKGHVTGAELDGNTTAEDLGFARMLSTKKDFIGRRSLNRPGLTDPKRPRLVGFVPEDGVSRLRAGAQIVADSRQHPPVTMIGRITSATSISTLGYPIALGLLEGGLQRKGETLHALFPMANQWTTVRVVDPVFYDPKGERLHG